MKYYAQFHDGFLTGVMIDSDTVRIYLETEHKEQYVLLCKGVVKMRADGIEKGNIVLDVNTYNYNDITADDIQRLYDIQGDDERAALLIQKMWEHFGETDCQMLEINPSYGGSVVLAAKSIDIIKQG